MVYYGVMTGDTSRPGYEELAAENAALRQRVAELSQRVVELEAALKSALEQLEAARRAGKRQAAPFSKGPPKENPKPPGRKAGHPPAHRDKPKPVKPIVTQFNVESARCSKCGQRAQACHPEQTSDALGAAAVQIGPQALGLAAEMKHGLGVPYRKVERVLDQALGLRVAPATLARSGQRLAAKAEPTYQLLLSTLRQEPVVNADETG